MDSRYMIRRAEVLSVYDDAEGLRIKVRISGSADGLKKDEDIDYCYPLLPKLLHINPKPGEAVLVLTEKLGAEDSQRYFIGPLLSQPYNYYKDLYSVSANSLLKDTNNNMKPYPAPSMNSDNTGSLPDRNDVALIGRKNTDLVLMENEVRLRCGMKKEPMSAAPNNLIFNQVDPAFIQMKYYSSPKKDLNDNSEFRSVVNVVGDRINLISPRDGNPMFSGVPDQVDMITDDTLCENTEQNILECAHPLVFGDDLVSYLKQFIEIFRTHTHPFSMLPPTFNQNDTDTLNTDLDSLLSRTVRCN